MARTVYAAARPAPGPGPFSLQPVELPAPIPQAAPPGLFFTQPRLPLRVVAAQQPGWFWSAFAADPAAPGTVAVSTVANPAGNAPIAEAVLRTYISPDGGHTWFPVALPPGALPDTTITAVQLAPPEVWTTVWQQALGGYGVTRLASAVIPR